jgi:glycosyltransferase involved in cell wall biosynthesis
MYPEQSASLRIIHCVRSPVGGTFRHIADLAREQARCGHHVGIALDASFGGQFEAMLVESLKPFLALGVADLPMSYSVGPRDLASTWRAIGTLGRLAPDVLHGHGAKGGLFARVSALALRLRGTKVASFYTPHGGSLHHDAKSLAGRAYFAVERALERGCDGIFHVSRYEQAQYLVKVGAPRCPASVVVNGLRPEEFEPVAPDTDATDVAVMGMFRALKGQDVLMRALALLRDRTGVAPSAHLIGEGPDEASLRALASELKIADRVTFRPLMPTREGFARAKVLVVPSRAESLPYIVLEAAAAALPLIASRVGGIPEILGESSPNLVTPGDPADLADAIQMARSAPKAAQEAALALRTTIRSRFSVEVMAETVLEAYHRALQERRGTVERRKVLMPAE